MPKALRILSGVLRLLPCFFGAVQRGISRVENLFRTVRTPARYRTGRRYPYVDAPISDKSTAYAGKLTFSVGKSRNKVEIAS